MKIVCDISFFYLDKDKPKGTVVTENGNVLPIAFDSICLHGDNPQAVRLAAAVSGALREAGVTIRAFAGPLK